MSETEEQIEQEEQEEFGDHTFSFKLNNPKILKAIVDTLSAIIDETQFFVTEEQLIVKAMDPSKIALLKLLIDKEDFDEFECEGSTKIGLNLEDFGKIIKRSSSQDSIEISHITGENKIRIQMIEEGSEKVRKFSLALLDIEIQDISLDNLLLIEYPSSWITDPDFLIEAIKDAEIYSEIMSIEAKENFGLKYTSVSQIGEMQYELGLDDFIETNIESTEQGSYSLIFLKAIMKLSSITEKFEVSLKTDHPLRMHFDLLDGGELYYFLAPRVEQTEEYPDEDVLEGS